MPFHLTEPHPSTSRPFIPTGRGGAGNYARVPSNVTNGASASGPASRAVLPAPPSSSTIASPSSSSSSSSSQKFTTGRGGAGNARPAATERAIFSFDEELAHEQRLQERAAPVFHCGRGGAGNVARSAGADDEYGAMGGVRMGGVSGTMGKGRGGRQGSSSSESSGASVTSSEGSGRSSAEGWGAKRSLEGAWSKVRTFGRP
ncbi:MAG: hypothetical protein M1821_002800 [Bathelium mastoideum]|nr:MAG: hypothetical protein M1821_002800 [Bathelium mastoideum]